MQTFNEVATVGAKVYWYPQAIMSPSTTPLVGFVAQGWSRGVADIIVFPAQDGAHMHVESVYHSSDPRIRKDGNRLSEGAIAQGCWEFAPEGHSPEMAKAIQLIVDFEKKLQEALTSIASLQKEVKDLQAKPQASKSK